MSISLAATSGCAYGVGALSGNTQRGQDIQDAAYHTVHEYPGGADALAVRMGMSPNTLRHKVNPNNTTHHLTLREAVTIQEMSNSHAILHSMADALGYVCTRATPGNDLEPAMDVLAKMHAELADLHRAIADALREEESVSINQMRRIDHHAQESIAAICNTLAMMRARMRKQPEGY